MLDAILRGVQSASADPADRESNQHEPVVKREELR